MTFDPSLKEQFGMDADAAHTMITSMIHRFLLYEGPLVSPLELNALNCILMDRIQTKDGLQKYIVCYEDTLEKNTAFRTDLDDLKADMARPPVDLSNDDLLSLMGWAESQAEWASPKVGWVMRPKEGQGEE